MQTLTVWFTRPRALLIVGLASVLVVAAACGGSGNSGSSTAREITLTARDVSFEPANLTLAIGQPVRLTLVNDGSTDHDVTIPGLNATDAIVEPLDEGGGDHHMMGSMMPGTVHMVAMSGDTATVEFTPRAGMFTFYCSVPGHREAGMTGTIVVQ